MLREIINIDRDKCDGCGQCAAACQEGAIGMVEGKAQLLREDYCDGLGNCLPACPTGAISFETREAAAFDERAVTVSQARAANAAARAAALAAAAPADSTNAEPPEEWQGCPGSRSQTIDRPTVARAGAVAATTVAQPGMLATAEQNELVNWPVQIKLAPLVAPYFAQAHLLIAADCCAYARANFHREFIQGRVTLIGCPKLDDVDYAEKLTEIIRGNDIKSVLILRMEVPCCGGLEQAAIRAMQQSGKFLPWQVVTIGTDGRILED